MKIFNSLGHDKYEQWVKSLNTTPTADKPSILDDPNCVEEVRVPTPEIRFCETKMDLMDCLAPTCEKLLSLRQAASEEFCARAFDTLAFMFFDSICPQENGLYHYSSKHPQLIYDLRKSDNQTVSLTYRHLIFGAYNLYHANPTAAAPFLRNIKASNHGEFTEQVGSNQELVSSPSLMGLLNALYVDKSGTVIPGFTSKGRKVPQLKKTFALPGSLRRFTKVFRQLKRTYDLDLCSVEELKELFPTEFSAWLEK